MTIDGHEIKKSPPDRAVDLVRWYLKYHKATGCQIDNCSDGGIPARDFQGFWDVDQCEYCAMIADAKKLIKEIDG